MHADHTVILNAILVQHHGKRMLQVIDELPLEHASRIPFYESMHDQFENLGVMCYHFEQEHQELLKGQADLGLAVQKYRNQPKERALAQKMLDCAIGNTFQFQGWRDQCLDLLHSLFPETWLKAFLERYEEVEQEPEEKPAG